MDLHYFGLYMLSNPLMCIDLFFVHDAMVFSVTLVQDSSASFNGVLL